MKEKCKTKWPGMGLMMAGAIVFVVGLTIVLFKELDIPRYWIPLVVGALLMAAGAIVRGTKSVCDHRADQGNRV